MKTTLPATPPGRTSMVRVVSGRDGARRCGSALLLVALASVVACSRGKTPAKRPVPEPGGTLHVGIFESIDYLSPVLSISPSTEHFLEYVTPPLAVFDEQGRVQMRLARGFEDSGAHLQFKLRHVFWEDGVPVTAQDLVLTTTLMRDHRVQSPERARQDLVQNVTAVDDSTLRYDYVTMYARRIRDAMVMPLPVHALPSGADPTDLRAWPLTQKPLSCGPFRVARASTEELVLDRNERSGFPPARLDHVVVRTLDPEAAVRDFRRGALDVLDDLPVDRIRNVRSVDGARIVALVGASYVFMGWNLQDARFADAAVRRAAAQAVDVRRLIEEATLGQGDPARGPLAPVQGFADTSAVLPFDPKAAARLLDRAGWRDSDSDGVRDRRGARLEFNLLVREDEPMRVAAANGVARDLRRIGMRVEVRPLSAQLLAQRLSEHVFEAFIGQWFPAAGMDLDAVWRSDAADRNNYGGYANSRVDSLLTQLEHERSDEDRAQLLAKLQAAVYADQPYLFLFQGPRFVVLSRRVRGAEPNHASPFWNLPEWWIPRALQAEPGTDPAAVP